MAFQSGIKGLAELERKLEKLADPQQVRQIVSHAYREGAKVIQAAAKERVPQDTGFLAKSLKVRSGRSRRGKVSMLVGEFSYRGDSFYGAMVEYGHALIRPGQRKTADRSPATRVPAKPFLRPAVDEKRAEVEQLISAQVGRDLDALFT